MQTAGMIYFILAMVVGLGAFGYAIYKSVNLVKDRRQTIDYKSYFKIIKLLNELGKKDEAIQ